MDHSDATFLNEAKTSIKITIGDEEQTFSIGDCITATINFEDEEPPKEIIGKINNFPHSDGKPNRIMYVPWRENEKRWSSTSRGNAIGLTGSYLGSNGIMLKSIKKVKCPDSAEGGKRRKRRATKKKARRSRHRRSRKH